MTRSAWTAYARRRGGAADLPPVLSERVGGKFANRATVCNGIRFDSKLEADRYRELVQLVQWGQVRYFLRQVPFDVAPRVVYRADFLVVWNRSGSADDVVTIEDTKGVMTQTSRVKIAVVEKTYGVRVTILRRADVSR